MRGTRAVAGVACALWLLAACGGDAEPRGPSASEAASGTLGEALSLMPGKTTDLYFTDWSALVEDPQDVLASMEGEGAFFQDLDERGLYPLVSFDSYIYPAFEELWGWNTDDVAWEATFRTEPGHPVHLLRFRDSFETSEIVPLLEERGFSETDEGGIAVYHHEQTMDAPWYMDNFGPRTPLSVLNMAMVDERTLLLSTEPEPLQTAVTSIAEGEGAPTAIAAPVAALGESPSVMAFSSDLLCSPPEGSDVPMSETALANAERLEGHEYEGLAIGLSGEGDPSATVVLHYGEAGAAEEDLDLREAAAEGPGITAGGPYSDVWFTLESATTEGQDLIMRFSPAANGMLGFNYAIRAGDLTFAAC